MQPPFELTSDAAGTVLWVRGDLDIAVDEQVVAAVADALAAGVGTAQLTLDLSGVDFIDSSGLRALLRIHKHYGPRVRVGALSAVVARLLELTGTADLFGSPGRCQGP